MKRPDITVYIVSHNYGRYLQDSIESVLRQAQDNWELLIMDNNSIDNTREVINLYKEDKRIRLFRLPGISLAAACNVAIKKAKGKYIIRLDADDVFDENILLVLSNYLDKHKDVALVFPDYFLIDDAGIIFGQERRQAVYENNHMLDMPANGASTMVRKNVLAKLGGYREDLTAQDGFDLWSRIVKKYKCANINLPLFYYRRHGKNLTEDNQRILSARRIIKKDISSLDLDKCRPIIAVIPCRKNYDIFPDLWSMKINEDTLLDRAIKTALNSSILDRIVVTSDNPRVQNIMAKYKDRRLCFIARNSRSTLISSPITHTLENIVKKLKIGWKGITTLLYIQAPFTSTLAMEESVYTLIMNDSDSAIAVEEVTFPLYKRTAHGLMPLGIHGNFRSDFDNIYQEVRTSIATRNANLKTGSLTGARITYFVLPKEETHFLRTKRDFEIAKVLVNI